MTQRKFLVIDDDEDDRRLLMSAIEKIVPSPSFTQARNGSEGLQVLHEGFIPDMIFIDLNMPVMNGIDFLAARLANKSFQDIPIVVMSTSTNPVVIEQIGKMGVDRYITKPSTDKDMFKAVVTALADREFASRQVFP